MNKIRRSDWTAFKHFFYKINKVITCVFWSSSAVSDQWIIRLEVTHSTTTRDTEFAVQVQKKLSWLLLKKPQLAKYFHCMLKLKTFFRLCFVLFLSSITGFGVCSCWVYSFQNTTDFSVSWVCTVYCLSCTPVGFFSLLLSLYPSSASLGQYLKNWTTENVEYSISSCATNAIFALLLPVTRQKSEWATIFFS